MSQDSFTSKTKIASGKLLIANCLKSTFFKLNVWGRTYKKCKNLLINRYEFQATNQFNRFTAKYHGSLV